MRRRCPKSWKTRGGEGGGGLLGNFVCHCFYYLEWFCGPIAGLGGRVFPLPDGESIQCQVQVAWIMELPKGSAAKFDVGLKFVEAPASVIERLSSLFSPAESV